MRLFGTLLTLPLRAVWRVFELSMIGSDSQKNRDFIINHNIKYKK